MKLIIFDLDGVLIDSQDIHFECLSQAIEMVVGDKISREYHDMFLDSHPLVTKLKMLNFDCTYHENIIKQKQLLTIQRLKAIDYDYNLIDIMKYIKENNIKITCASNSMYESVKLSLLKLGVMEYIDYFISSEDVCMGKPHPEMFFKCMSRFNSSPKDTVIFDDSEIGLRAAHTTGAHVVHIPSRRHLSKKVIKPFIYNLKFSSVCILR